MPSAPQRMTIGRSTGRCASTGAAIAPGTACMSVLRDLGDAGFERLDYSIDAWERGERPTGDFYFWRTIVPAADERRAFTIDDEVLEDMLARLEDDARPERIAFRWLVALMLLRKRRLRHLRVEPREGGETWLFQRKGDVDGAPPLAVVNPHLAEDDLVALAEQLGAFVEADSA